MIVLEVVLEPEDAEVLEAIAEKWGVSLEIVACLVGSEMCIRDRYYTLFFESCQGVES